MPLPLALVPADGLASSLASDLTGDTNLMSRFSDPNIFAEKRVVLAKVCPFIMTGEEPTRQRKS
jgi:hypothetical protein